MMQALERLADYFESMSAASVIHIGSYYADDAHFKDPFNEVRGLAEVQHIFEHMYVALDRPRFVITARMVDGDQCFLS